jgi:hypothetical protein
LDRGEQFILHSLEYGDIGDVNDAGDPAYNPFGGIEIRSVTDVQVPWARANKRHLLLIRYMLTAQYALDVAADRVRCYRVCAVT